MAPDKKKCIDLLVEEFWRKGYLIIRRKLGTYLPEPGNIGDFEVDIVATQRRSYAIGITLMPEELNNPDLTGKLTYLASRQTRITSSRVLLFVGIPAENLPEARELIKKLDPAAALNIRIIPLSERKSVFVQNRRNTGLFA